MGRADQRVHGGLPGGGSLDLADLLDKHGEDLFIDLLKVYQFNLVAFLRGEAAGSPRLILTMIRHLPEGTNYVAALQSAPAVELPEPPIAKEPTIDPVAENLMWTQDRLLMAQLINSVNMLVRHSIQWQDGKAPKLPVIGPAEWRGEGDKPKTPKPLTVMDVINNVMGHTKNG